MSIKHVAASFMAALLLTAGTAYGFSTTFPTGVTNFDPDQAYIGYTLINSGRAPHKYLVDMNGNAVHTWANVPGDRARLLPNGNLLTLNQAEKKVVEYDWDGKVVWEYKTNRGPHHDLQRLPNGNTLILTFEDVPVAKLAQVKDHEDQWYGKIKRTDELIKGDSIIEVNPKGEIVWEWRSSDHLDLNRFMPLRPSWDWTHGNTVTVIPENKWYDAGDTRFKPGNIIYNPRHFDEIQVIDKETGKIVAKIATKDNKGFSNGHEAHMIAKGLPGAGNVLFFDNGALPKNMQHVGATFLYELDPTTGKTVWSFGNRNEHGWLFSATMGSLSKLPNGNVLVSEDNTGRVLQLKPKAEKGAEFVWEYVAPITGARSTMYAPDYCPQLKAMPAQKLMKVTPIPSAELRILPDALRKDGKVAEVVKK